MAGGSLDVSLLEELLPPNEVPAWRRVWLNFEGASPTAHIVRADLAPEGPEAEQLATHESHQSILDAVAAVENRGPGLCIDAAAIASEAVRVRSSADQQCCVPAWLLLHLPSSLALVTWQPDQARIRAKMLHASLQSAFVSAVRRHAAATPKPLPDAQLFAISDVSELVCALREAMPTRLERSGQAIAWQWSPDTHHCFPVQARRAVETVLMAHARQDGHAFGMLPKAVVLMCILPLLGAGDWWRVKEGAAAR